MKAYWKPISTAPKDRVVVIYSKKFGPVFASWLEDDAEWSACGDTGDGHDAWDLSDATHWDGIPQEPECTPEQEGKPIEPAKEQHRVLSRTEWHEYKNSGEMVVHAKDPGEIPDSFVVAVGYYF